MVSHCAEVQNQGDYGYYVEQGGKGFGWIMQALALIYSSDKLRASYRMATYGRVDRRIHLPVHTADLISHELLTNRHTSPILNRLGEQVVVQDVTADDVGEIMGRWSNDRRSFDRLLREALDRKAAEIAREAQPHARLDRVVTDVS
jgi:hypothetical protein